MSIITEIITNLLFLTMFYNLSAYLCYNQTITKRHKMRYKYIQRYCTYIYSSLHSFIIVIGSILYIFGYIRLNTFRKYTTFTSSYALFDIIVLSLNKKLRFAFFIHHAILLISTIINLPHDYLYKYLAYGLLGEISSIYLNKTWFYLHNTPINREKVKKNAKKTIFLYTIFRIINYLYIIKVAITNQYYLGVIFMIIIYILNLYWYIILIKKAISI